MIPELFERAAVAAAVFLMMLGAVAAIAVGGVAWLAWWCFQHVSIAFH